MNFKILAECDETKPRHRGASQINASKKPMIFSDQKEYRNTKIADRGRDEFEVNKVWMRELTAGIRNFVALQPPLE